MQRRYPPDESGDRALKRVLETGEPLLVVEVTPEVFKPVARNEEHLDMLLQLGLQSYIVCILVLAGSVRGAITFLTVESGRHYGQEDLVLAQDLAARQRLPVEIAAVLTGAGCNSDA